MNKSPSFQFYPDKWIAGTIHLDAESYRAYHRILCWMWLHAPDQCSMPDTDDVWRMATGLDYDTLEECRIKIMHPGMALLENSNGKIVSHGLKKEAKKQKEYRVKQSINAKTRWHKQVTAKPPHIQPHIGSLCSPTPTPTPTPKEKNKRVQAPHTTYLKFVKPTPEQITEYGKKISFEVDGQAFCDYYEARGWKYKGGLAMKDWQAAVRTWKKQGNYSSSIQSPKRRFDDKTAIRDRAIAEIMDRLKIERLATPEESFMEIAARLALSDKYKDIPGAVDKAVWTLNYERKA